MLYARFMHPDHGYPNDGERAEKAGLVVGKRYLVKDVDMGQSYTSIKLDCYEKKFNSVLFEFEREDCSPVTIFADQRYNRYAGKRGSNV